MAPCGSWSVFPTRSTWQWLTLGPAFSTACSLDRGSAGHEADFVNVRTFMRPFRVESHAVMTAADRIKMAFPSDERADLAPAAIGARAKSSGASAPLDHVGIHLGAYGFT
jgi:hypothetical protein